MCRIPKVVIVAVAADHLELRRSLGSLEYDIVGTIAPGQRFEGRADVAVVVGASPDGLETARGIKGAKIVAVGLTGTGADLELPAGELAAFKTRIWELFRPQPG